MVMWPNYLRKNPHIEYKLTINYKKNFKRDLNNLKLVKEKNNAHNMKHA